MKTGSVIDAAAMKQAGLETDVPFLAKTAFGAMNTVIGDEGAEEHIIERVNGMKTEYGTSASTLVTIYNALGLTLRLHDHRDVYGSFYKYSPDHEIFNGEWSGLLHVHPTAQAIGSHGLLCYALEDSATLYNEAIVLMIAWANHYSGANQCGCGFTNQSNYDAHKADMYDYLTKSAKASGRSDYGVLGVEFEIGSETSPIFRVVASQGSNL